MSTAVDRAPRQRLLICGFWEGNRDQAPYADESFDVWGLNHLWPWIPRWDRWFDMHSPEWTSQNLKPEIAKEQLAFFAKSHGKPIYMLEQYAGIPDAVAYPKAAVSAKFRRYYTSGIAYMLALALFEGQHKEIQLWGIDMRHNEEYALQRPCVEYWLGLAEGLGVKVAIPPSAAILSADHDYGYEEAGGLPAEAIRAHQKILAAAVDQKHQALAAAQTYDGIIQDNQEWIRRWDQKTRGGIL